MNELRIIARNCRNIHFDYFTALHHGQGYYNVASHGQPRCLLYNLPLIIQFSDDLLYLTYSSICLYPNSHDSVSSVNSLAPKLYFTPGTLLDGVILDASELDMDWIHPWIGLDWIGLGQKFCPLHCFSED